jgi:four helix bundle protein
MVNTLAQRFLKIALNYFIPVLMFLKLDHQKMDIYEISKKFVLECYKLSKFLPIDEKFGMISQIRRAALSVHLNIAEGASRKSVRERKRFYEIAHGSVIEIDAALDIANNLDYLNIFDTKQLGELMTRCFKILTGLTDVKH